MNFVVQPSALQSGTVIVPGDKSISHRALMLGGIAEGETAVRGFLNGEDCLATMTALRAMGVNIETVSETDLKIVGAGKAGLKAPGEVLDLGNSGTAMRLFAGLLAGQAFASVLTGDASLRNRPMDRVIRPLTTMGADIVSVDGRPPLEIRGKRGLRGIVYKLPVASAQVKSAILIAGLFSSGEVGIIEPATTRDHTERMLRSMGVDVRSGETQIIMQGGQALAGARIDVPADLSSAAFFILAALIAADVEVTLTGVGVNPTRTGVIDILRQMGADIRFDNVRLYGEEPVADIVVRSSALTGIDVDPGLVSLAIDEFPVLFVAAAVAKGRTVFTDIGELRVKESDRISAMAEGLRALGITVDESIDGAVVHGGKLLGGAVSSHGDHRVAMSLAVAATVAEWAVYIDDTGPVNTSFPGFVDKLRSLGVDILAGEDPDVEAGL